MTISTCRDLQRGAQIPRLVTLPPLGPTDWLKWRHHYRSFWQETVLRRTVLGDLNAKSNISAISCDQLYCTHHVPTYWIYSSANLFPSAPSTPISPSPGLCISVFSRYRFGGDTTMQGCKVPSWGFSCNQNHQNLGLLNTLT